MIGSAGPSEPVLITADGVTLAGVLALPSHPCGMVLYLQAREPRRAARENACLADQFRRAGLATLQLDPPGSGTRRRAPSELDLALLEARLYAMTDWIAAQPRTQELALGVFGTGSGAAAALRLAARRSERIAAVVSSCGRPDLAGPEALARVRAPTLLIVDEQDRSAIEHNRRALSRLNCEKDLALIPEASQPGKAQDAALEAARLAARWFKGYFGGDTRPATPRAAPGA